MIQNMNYITTPELIGSTIAEMLLVIAHEEDDYVSKIKTIKNKLDAIINNAQTPVVEADEDIANPKMEDLITLLSEMMLLEQPDWENEQHLIPSYLQELSAMSDKLGRMLEALR